MRIDKRNHFNNYSCAVAHGRPYVGSDGEPFNGLFATAHYSDRERTQDRLLVAYDEKKKRYILVGEKLPLHCAQITLSKKD
jgi:hypothetical protein